jgi:hypothetical protein
MTSQVLITTNVVARGIDILQVNMVVNYDLPLMNERDKNLDDKPDIETYIHRIGPYTFYMPAAQALIFSQVVLEGLDGKEYP